MCKNVEGLNGRFGRAVDWTVTITRILTPLLITAMGWAWWNHEERLDEVTLSLKGIETSRFTAADGLEVYKLMAQVQQQVATKADIGGAEPVWREIENIKGEIARLRDEQ